MHINKLSTKTFDVDAQDYKKIPIYDGDTHTGDYIIRNIRSQESTECSVDCNPKVEYDYRNRAQRRKEEKMKRRKKHGKIHW